MMPLKLPKLGGLKPFPKVRFERLAKLTRRNAMEAR